MSKVECDAETDPRSVPQVQVQVQQCSERCIHVVPEIIGKNLFPTGEFTRTPPQPSTPDVDDVDVKCAETWRTKINVLQTHIVGIILRLSSSINKWGPPWGALCYGKFRATSGKFIWVLTLMSRNRIIPKYNEKKKRVHIKTEEVKDDFPDNHPITELQTLWSTVSWCSI